MRPGDIALGKEIKEGLLTFCQGRPLPGIMNINYLDCLVEQIIDSIRRIKYITLISNIEIEQVRSDASSNYFDPLKASIWHKNQNNINEAFWLVFLSTHFGRNHRTQWNLTKDVYGGLGHPFYWNWTRTCANIDDFCLWIDENGAELSKNGSFGNHRKFESLANTGATINSYIEWIGEGYDHLTMIKSALENVNNNKRAAFDSLYNSMSQVIRFGRLAKFDYLTMLGKLGLANIEPGSTYMGGATGPFYGACLLFSGNKEAKISISTINDFLFELDAHLDLFFGMQVLEDALCNWQKNPVNYEPFRG